MALYVVSRLVLSQIVTRPAAQQLHGVGWWGGPGHYIVTPTRVEVELGCENWTLPDFRGWEEMPTGVHKPTEIFNCQLNLFKYQLVLKHILKGFPLSVI